MTGFHSRCWKWLYLYWYLLSGVYAALFGYSQVDGRNRLGGSSFGVLGKNATFDYVVRGQIPLQIHLSHAEPDETDQSQ